MAVVAVSSTLITNNNASPPLQNAMWSENSRERTTGAFVSVTNGDSIGSTYRLLRLFPNQRIVALKLFNNAITSGAGNLGLYRTLADGGAVVSAACYAAAISIASASTTGTELKFSARTLDKMMQQIWQDAGLAANPSYPLDLVLTLTAAAAATGFVAVECALAGD